MEDPTKAVSGGAQETEVTIVPLAPEVEESEATVNVVTSAPGTLGPEGIVAVGTKATVALSAYSKNWMRPATKADDAKIKKFLAAK